MSSVEDYAAIVGEDVISQLRQLAAPLKGMKVVHVNSTRVGGGVAEILTKLVPLMEDLGIDVRWEVIQGEEAFFHCTKSFHNALQGTQVPLSEAMVKAYEETNATNAEELRPMLEEADFVFIHDPQPLQLLRWCPGRKGRWLWRCHIDLSRPYRPVWRYLRQFVVEYDASHIFAPGFRSTPAAHPVSRATQHRSSERQE